MNTLPFSPERPLPPVRPCVQCVHFAASDKTCRVYGNVNVIDGSIMYAAACVVRPNLCREKYFKPVDSSDAFLADKHIIDVKKENVN